jgi:hypothetical protein
MHSTDATQNQDDAPALLHHEHSCLQADSRCSLAKWSLYRHAIVEIHFVIVTKMLLNSHITYSNVRVTVYQHKIFTL